MVNATGWNELMDGNMVKAAFTMYNIAWNSYIVIILFFVFQIMLFMKTRSWPLLFTTGIIFLGMLASLDLLTDTTFISTRSVILLATVLALELAGVIYASFIKA